MGTEVKKRKEKEMRSSRMCYCKDVFEKRKYCEVTYSLLGTYEYSPQRPALKHPPV